MSEQSGNGPQDPNTPRDPSQDPAAQQTPPAASGEKPFYMRPVVLTGAGIAVIAIIGAVAFMGPSGDPGSAPGAKAEGQQAQLEANEAANPNNWELGRPGDIVMGDRDAPVKLVEYASLTCGHCANFKLTVFPDIKKKYIDSGLVQYTLREFPTPPVSLSVAGFMLARCAGEDRYYSAMEALFRTQPLWVKGDAQEARRQLEKISRQFGLNEDEFETCISNEEELQRIRTVVEAGQEIYGINSTPSFVINGRKANIRGATFEALDSVIQERLPEGTEVPDYTPTGYSPPEGEPGDTGEDEESADEAASDEGEEGSEEGTSEDGASEEGTTEEDEAASSEEGASEEGTSEEGAADEGTSGDGTAEEGEAAGSEEGTSEEGAAEEGDTGAEGEGSEESSGDAEEGGEAGGEEPSEQ